MPLMTAAERGFARAISKLVFANPFLPERIDAEREALGRDFIATRSVWSARAQEEDSPNLPALNARAQALADALRERLAKGTAPRADEPSVYEDVVLYVLYSRYFPDLHRLIVDPSNATARLPAWPRFVRDVEHYLAVSQRSGDGALPVAVREDPTRLIAFFFQIRRAFHLTFSAILGGSLPAARLRAAVWQSIFTRDLRRYRRALFERMHDVTTLIAGPSGTGKELVAQAIGRSRYIPFDPQKQAFVEDFASGFFPLNLSALPATLVESELFGHRRGAFTGAVQDRAGWLEVCPPLGTVFLDEVAEIEPSMQVKLLRVLQARTFQRIGETRERQFRGKLIAATNRDLAAEIQAGRFREDFYYRLCADVIETPSLASQLREAPEELGNLLRFLAGRIAGEAEAEAVAAETERWISGNLEPGYPWPGNVRELEQCVRNVMIRGEYRPRRPAVRSDDDLAAAMATGALTADELLRRYCTLVFARTGSYLETARRLELDRRTVKDRVDAALLARLQGKDTHDGIETERQRR
jgi:DNA-binding NtrC family response regulator